MKSEELVTWGIMTPAITYTMHESISRCEPQPTILRMSNLAALTYSDGVIGLETPCRVIGNREGFYPLSAEKTASPNDQNFQSLDLNPSDE